MLCACWQQGAKTFAETLTLRQVLAVMVLAVVLLVVVVELVRKRKLREEYAFLWMGTAILLSIMALWTDLLVWFQELIGTEAPASALWFGALVFMMFVLLQLSVRISKMSFREKALAQRTALLEKEISDLRRQLGVRDPVLRPEELEARPEEVRVAGGDQ